ncbi:5'-3' exoribonuclease [Fadolivirus algeromassiliense]|jgi:5'-3' exonuclease|uniref:5'-3' exoribonuclease n=1 Tax=Fadolivirus FV1/VV64 TaxID=3070911 RepID=A0A7D3QTV3_9VIRU|nr:5'-3' exoribonuclease [Fadolivirus algeromassiliense]QKF93623.1 5'-3' exoribonuclease [Fadolivirus FV1/VV64]
MGIYNFHAWLRKHYPGSYAHIQHNNIYDFIYIDVNFILHNAIYGSKSEKEFINKLYMQLNIIFSNFIATKQIYFALDGPSSYAKVLLQRKRRSQTSKKISKNVFSSLYITPGTEKMNMIEKHLVSYIAKLKTKYKFIKPEIKISLSSDPDEGEIKICKRVIDNGKDNLDLKHLIIGNDSDLIVLSMGMKPIYNIYILVKGKGSNELISLSKLLSLYAKFINRENKISDLAYSNLRDDFVIISVMMGNDYLPKMGYINHEELWRQYYKLIKSNSELTLIKNGTFDLECARKLMFMIYNSLSPSFKKISIKTMNESRSKSYINGLLWCLTMYNTGVCPKYDYIYTGNQAPHPYELYFYLCGELNDIILPVSNSQPIPLEIYPLLILPKKAIELIPTKYHTLIDGQLKYLYEIEDCDKCTTYRSKFKILYKQIKDEIDEELVEKIKEKYKLEMAEYMKHKKIHAEFNINDIYKILNIV